MLAPHWVFKLLGSCYCWLLTSLPFTLKDLAFGKSPSFLCGQEFVAATIE